ncbi:hypothetical protein HPB48_001449 [Haemaphysalis longicornis]|uniref:Tick transposon n=1 Tax=Haemaphysalis longicornis TaxID=44386 RepID=A0A9J6FI55_HAELO|nr:hypothetical protein HPB48_001449 [Haemaphysalis longicornis]
MLSTKIRSLHLYSPRNKLPPNPPYKFLYSHPILHTQQLRLLGLTLTHNRYPASIVQYVKKYITQTTHLVRHIATKHHGTMEQDRVRLVHSVLLNRILYHLPYLNVAPIQLDSLDALLRKTKTCTPASPLRPTHLLLDVDAHCVYQPPLAPLRIPSSSGSPVIYLEGSSQRHLCRPITTFFTK